MNITAVTLNTQHCLNAGARAIGTAIADAGADIAFLQEVDTHAARSQWLNYPKRLAAATNLPHVHYAPAIRWTVRRYGLLTLSRYPLHERSAIQLPRSSGEEPRVAQVCTINLDPHRIRLVNVHLSTDLASGSRQLEHLLETLAPQDVPTVLAGDFNGQPVPEGFTAPSDLLTWPADHPRAALDRILLSPTLSPRATWDVPGRPVVSDHRMVAVRFGIGDTGLAEGYNDPMG